MSHPEMSSRNEVERLMNEMNAGEIEPENFAHALISQQIFIPIQDERHMIAGFQLSTKATPLVVEDEEGSRVLIAFSAPERAKAFIADHPGYSDGLLTEVSWILRRIGADMGLSINPGQDPGFDFDADMVAMLASLLPEEEV